MCRANKAKAAASLRRADSPERGCPAVPLRIACGFPLRDGSSSRARSEAISTYGRVSPRHRAVEASRFRRRCTRARAGTYLLSAKQPEDLMTTAPHRVLNGDAWLVLAAASCVYELHPGQRDQYVRERLGLRPDGYWQLLRTLPDDRAAAACMPGTVRDLREGQAVSGPACEARGCTEPPGAGAPRGSVRPHNAQDDDETLLRLRILRRIMNLIGHDKRPVRRDTIPCRTARRAGGTRTVRIGDNPTDHRVDSVLRGRSGRVVGQLLVLLAGLLRRSPRPRLRM